MKKLILLMVLVMLGGCATVKVTELSSVESKVGSFPKIGEQATTPVGSIIYSQFKYWSKVGYRLKGDFSVNVGLGKVRVSGGDFVIRAEVENQPAFCSEKLAYIDPLSGPFKTACFIDKDGSGTFAKMKVAPGVVWFEYEVAPPLAYEKSELIIPRADSFKYELLYQGTSKGSLKLSYREYMNDFARPAFFQDVTYDIESMPATVTFRTVRLEILSANNNQLVYRVLSGF